jgi:hypothetical protein
VDAATVDAILLRSPIGRLLAPCLTFLWGRQQAAASSASRAQCLLLDLAPSFVPLLRSLNQVSFDRSPRLWLHLLLRNAEPRHLTCFPTTKHNQVLVRLASSPPQSQSAATPSGPTPYGCSLDEQRGSEGQQQGDRHQHHWLRQLEQVVGLLGGLAVEAQLRSEFGVVDDGVRRHARWFDDKCDNTNSSSSSSSLLATLPAPELLGALLPHIAAECSTPQTVASPRVGATSLLAAATTATTATATAIATPPRPLKRTLLAPRRSVIYLCAEEEEEEENQYQ